jgi:hypothetical protein
MLAWRMMLATHVRVNSDCSPCRFGNTVIRQHCSDGAQRVSTRTDERDEQTEAEDWTSNARGRSTEADHHAEAHEGGAHSRSRRGPESRPAHHGIELVSRSRPRAARHGGIGRKTRPDAGAMINVCRVLPPDGGPTGYDA